MFLTNGIYDLKKNPLRSQKHQPIKSFKKSFSRIFWKDLVKGKFFSARKKQKKFAKMNFLKMIPPNLTILKNLFWLVCDSELKFFFFK